MIHAQQIGLVADVNHDGSFPTGLSVFLFRSHATVFFAADIFFRGRKIDIGWDACGRNAPFDIGKELNCVL